MRYCIVLLITLSSLEMDVDPGDAGAEFTTEAADVDAVSRGVVEDVVEDVVKNYCSDRYL